MVLYFIRNSNHSNKHKIELLEFIISFYKQNKINKFLITSVIIILAIIFGSSAVSPSLYGPYTSSFLPTNFGTSAKNFTLTLTSYSSFGSSDVMVSSVSVFSVSTFSSASFSGSTYVFSYNFVYFLGRNSHKLNDKNSPNITVKWLIVMFPNKLKSRLLSRNLA